MKSYIKLSLLLCFFQINSTSQDYSKMSSKELDEAFIIAVKNDFFDEMEKLLKAGANVNTPISYVWTSGDCDWNIESSAFIYAAKRNRPNVIKVLLKFVDKKNINEAFVIAIEEGYSDVVEELIKGRAPINHVNKNKDTLLIMAIKHARATAEFSSQAQARFRSRWHERREIIQMLLKAGADVTHVNKDGRTALMEAVIEHDLNTVQSLLQISAMTTGSYFGFGTKPINYADKDGNTALILAIQNVRYSYINNQEYNICLSSQNIIEALLKTPGIDFHHVNKNGDTAIKLLKKIDEATKRMP